MSIKKRLCVVALYCSSILVAACSWGAVLSNNGKPGAVIVLGSDAIPAEHTAAKELSCYLKQITGADFKTVESAKDAGNMVRIFVGQTQETKNVLKNFDWEKLSQDGIIIRCRANDIVLAGDRPRGTLYAVYTYLEDYAGCRWWAPDAEYIPKKPTLKLANMNYVYKPPFFYRETFYGSVRASNPFTVKLKCNGHFERIPEELGGHLSIIGWCQTFDQIMPRSKYFASHPEWYSLRDGSRYSSYGQLCLTNREMCEEFIKNALERIRKNPSAGVISISQNDNRLYCQCPECTAAANKLGNQTDLMLDFVNEVARAVKKEFPKFKIVTLAYTYTTDPPVTVKPDENVIISLCTVSCNFAQPLNSDANSKFHSQINGWNKITSQLFIWDYTTNFTTLQIPHPNYYMMLNNIKFFSKSGAIGIFSQGDIGNRETDFQMLRAWVVSKLQWNPNLDANKLVDEYLRGYYGAAGPYMKQILDTYIGAANRENVYLGCYMAGNPYFKAADYIKAFGLFDKAHAAETDPSIRERIKTQRRSLELSLYLNSSAVEDQVVASGLIAHVDIDKWSRDYYDWATSTHNDYFKEGGKLTFSKFMSLGLASMNTPKSEKTPRACAGLADDDWVELQEDIATLFSAGNLIIKEEDLLASDGKTVRMPGNHYEWVFQMPMGAVVRKGITRGEVFVSVRVKSTGKGKGFSFGLYDTGTAKAAGAKAISASDTGADEYKEYSLGVCDITNSMYLWVAPPKSPEVDSVYVDRVFVIKKD
jgi:hypothetical protein